MGFVKLGPLAAVCSTLNRRMLVPFHTPTVPFCTTISAVKIKPHNNDSYQPSARGVQENRCIRGGDGSIAGGRIFGGMLVEAFDDDSRRVKVVCKGRVGSQDSIWGTTSVR